MAYIALPGTIGVDNLVATDADTYITGLAGADTLVGGAGDDLINSGVGADDVTLGLGADILQGEYTDFDGDTVQDFSTEDTMIFDSYFSPLNINWTAGATSSDPGTFEVDRGGVQTTFTMNGFDTTEFTFMAIKDGGTTIVTLQPLMGTLTEGAAISGTANGVINENFFTGGAKNFEIDISADVVTSSNNTLGVYEIDATGNIVDVRIIANNVNDYKTDGTSEGQTITVTGVDSGNILAFFVVHNGSAWADTNAANTLTFAKIDNSAWTTADTDDVFLFVDGTRSEETVFHTYLETMNVGDTQRALSGADATGEIVTVGIEDSGDNDFNDIVFDVSEVLFL